MSSKEQSENSSTDDRSNCVSPKDYENDPKVKLSGRILNVMTSLPTKIVRNYDKKTQSYSWDVEMVRGNSALFSSQTFLDNESPWESHLIAWTGELVNKIQNTSQITTENIKDDPLYLDEDDKSEIEEKLKIANNSNNIHPVWLLRKDQSRWRKYPEQVLWPVFHYIQNMVDDSEAWHDYVKFNASYANAIKKIYKPGDIIWIHDYYLLLLPSLLRMEFPDSFVGLFLHSPFPSSEYFRTISKRSQILDGMLGADKIGFQNNNFVRHFMSCCSRVLGCEVTKNKVFAYGTTISVEALPIGIDTLKIEQEDVSEKVEALKDLYKGKKLIVGRDRLDKVRGVVQKLQAFQCFLDMFPQWREKVVLVQVSSPGFSQASVEKQVGELINSINIKYGSLNYTPVLHYQIMLEKREYFALLRAADLCLITSVRDGMSTTALEFVICQRNNNSPLILSEFTGTASVLNNAILVNPWDAVGVAKTMNEALLLSDNNKKLLEQKLYDKVTSNTIQNWTSTFIRDIINHAKATHSNHSTPSLDRPKLLQQFKSSKRRLFLFDYDGTLTPIVQDPAAAIPSDRLNKILDILLSDERNQVWIISGRDQEFLQKWFGKKAVGLSAEHGCFLKSTDSQEWFNLAESFDMSWQKVVKDIFKKYCLKTPNSVIEEKKVAITWHYRRTDPELGKYQADECLAELNDLKGYDIEVMSGKANIEVRPKFVNKGEIVKRLVLHPHGLPQQLSSYDGDVKPEELPDFVLCLGDDQTDEDMFKSLLKIENQWKLNNISKNEFGSYGIYPVAVGPASKKTIATAHLNEPKQVLETLGLLAAQVSLFESPGTVELDDRGHLENSESSNISKQHIKDASMLKKKKSLDI
ncbi:unnamed protein product [Candida verbasci]|uniref:Trehalose-phosphatase n=1 Tax=Candida verbasci TaxID=1227364 RepID=A0A9W4TUY0_9ASCO|nr:unnamed protein product [Candida verbasci]